MGAPDICPFGVVPRDRGLGDTISKVTRKMGIKPCKGCKKRRALLNKLFPYGVPVKKEDNHHD